jgi:hypothetical protein
MLTAVAADRLAVLQLLVDFCCYDDYYDTDTDSDESDSNAFPPRGTIKWAPPRDINPEHVSDMQDDDSNTLLHAAAAWGSQRCATLLIQLSGGYGLSDVNTDNHTALDLACAAVVPESLCSYSSTRADWSVRKQIALLLLEAGAKVDARKLAGNEQYAEVVTEHNAKLTAKLRTCAAALAAHALSRYTEYECTTAAESTARVDTAAADVAVADAAVAAAADTAPAPAAAAAVAAPAAADMTIVKKFQLVNAATGVKGKRVYAYDSALLVELHRIVNPVWDAGAVELDFGETVQAEQITLLPYRGTSLLSYTKLYCTPTMCSPFSVRDHSADVTVLQYGHLMYTLQCRCYVMLHPFCSAHQLVLNEAVYQSSRQANPVGHSVLVHNRSLNIIRY